LEGEHDEPIVLASAHRHGVQEEDMLPAVRHAVRWFTLDDEMTMVIGPSTTGALLEVGTVGWHGDRLASVQAMPAREKILR
jgi:hypothetical protein